MDFGARIADAQGTKNASKAAFNNYQAQSDQAKSNYDAHLQNRRTYGDIYDQARDKYMNTDEINKARGVYTTARDAVNQINTTINKLPESIRQQYGGTGLTEAQRQRALQGQLGSMQNTQNYLNTNYQNASTDYNELVNRAMNEVNNVAAGNYKTQEDTTNILQGIWNTLLGQRNSAYGQYQQDENALANIYGARDTLPNNPVSPSIWLRNMYTRSKKLEIFADNTYIYVRGSLGSWLQHRSERLPGGGYHQFAKTWVDLSGSWFDFTFYIFPYNPNEDIFVR